MYKQMYIHEPTYLYTQAHTNIPYYALIPKCTHLYVRAKICDYL